MLNKSFFMTQSSFLCVVRRDICICLWAVCTMQRSEHLVFFSVFHHCVFCDRALTDLELTKWLDKLGCKPEDRPVSVSQCWD